MQSINKIHSTSMSLNDRFTVIQTVPPNAAGASSRRRRSISVNSRTAPKSSLQNRRLLEQLDQKHKLRMAMRLKKKSLKRNLPLRQRLNNQIRSRKLKAGINGTSLMVGRGRLQRTNSLRNIGTMQADLVGNPNGRARLRRSNSTSNLAARLGVRGQGSGVNSRRHLIRNNVAEQRSRSRSRSRQKLIRSNSQTNLGRINSKQSLASLKRSNSQVRGRSASRQQPRLQRSNSRANLNNGNRIHNINAGAKWGNGSINERLGVKQVTQKQNFHIQRGRIIKQRNPNINFIGNIRNNVAVQRSRSRQNLIRSNSQTNLRRINSKQSLAPLKRSNSQVRGRSTSRQRPRLQRSNSRANLNGGNGIRNINGGAKWRNSSINGRLGVKQVTQKQNFHIQHDRVIKQRNPNVNFNGNFGNNGRNGVRQRVARSRTRVAQINPRNRSSSGGRNGRQTSNYLNRNNQQNRSRQNGRRRGGRSQSRGRAGRPNAAPANNPTKTKEQLDNELDQYMFNTKGN